MAAAVVSLAALGCASLASDDVETETAAVSQGAAACCDLVKAHVRASYGMVGGLDECVDEATDYCASGDAERECCTTAARVLDLAAAVKERTEREGCAVTPQIASRIEQCARYHLAERLCGLPKDQRDACLEERTVAMPARYKGLDRSPGQCTDPKLTGPFGLRVHAPNITGTPPNCHGTAAKIHGIDLEPLVTRDRSKWQSARGASALPDDCNDVEPDVNELVVEGFTVNMEHGDTAEGAEKRCGSPMYTVTGCTPRPRAVLWLHGMTRQCFQNELRKIGLRPVEKTDPLVPGCVLTQNDHTLTIVEREAAMCQIYEKTTPYGIAWYRWEPCCSLTARFDSIYCPSP